MFPGGLPALLCVPGFQALRLRTRGRAGPRPAPPRGQVAVGGESRHDARPQGTCRSRRLWGADRGDPEGPVIVHSQGAWPTRVCGRSGPRVWLSEGTGTARGWRGPLQTRDARPRPQFLIRAGRCFGLRVRSRGETGRKAGDPLEGERAAEARHGAGHGLRAPDSCSCAGGSGEGGRGRSAEAPRSCRPEPVRPRPRVSAAGSPWPCVNGPLGHSAGSTVPRRAQWGHA